VIVIARRAKRAVAIHQNDPVATRPALHAHFPSPPFRSFLRPSPTFVSFVYFVVKDPVSTSLQTPIPRVLFSVSSVYSVGPSPTFVVTNSDA